MKKLINHFTKFLLLALVMFSTSAMGQISANYLILGPTSGCGSLAVEFQDISSGNPTSWWWDFGNGLTSTDQHPVMVFYPGIYNVTLKVSDSVSTDILQISDVIKVYELPQVDFTADFTSGCLPLEVSFEDLSLSSSPIVSWFWDFGDGGNDTIQYPSYLFNSSTEYDISLLVTDSNNCSSIATKWSYIITEEKPQIEFTATPEFTCLNNQQIDFINNTQSSQSLSYEWDFGDGQSSTLQNPIHWYTNQGMYSVKLTASSSVCSESITKFDFITVEGVLGVDFTVDENVGCEDNYIATFEELASSNVTDWFWDFGDGNTSTLANPSHNYSYSGFYDVTLMVSNQGNCIQQLTKQQYIEVLPKPTVYFSAVDSVACQTPFLLQLKDSTLNAISWTWKVEDSCIGYAQSEQLLIDSSGLYNVFLEVEDDNGCKNSLLKNNYIIVDPVQLNFTSDFQSGCNPLEVKFIPQVNSISSITEYQWDFGNGFQSYDEQPIHTYNIEGMFDVSLVVKNQLGCMFTSIQPDYIKVTNPANTMFASSTNTICGNDSVSFFDLSSSVDPINSWYWDFGSAPHFNSTLQNPTHVFQDTGYHSISLMTEVSGCLDTLFLDSFVYVASPIALFYPIQNCDDYTSIQFHNESVDYDSCVWDFGDGTISYINHPNHYYSTYGVYEVTLKVFNIAANCVGEISHEIAVEPPYPNLIINPSFSSEGCPPLTVLFHDISPYSDENPNSPYNVADKIIFGDGNWSHYNYQNTYEYPGYYSVKHIVGNPLGCMDTLTYDSLIHVYDAQANVSVGNVLNCNPFTLELLDASVSDDTIIAWNWISNGQNYNQINPVFTYFNEGEYDVTLQIMTSDGCRDTIQFIDLVEYTIPNAEVHYNTQICLHDTVHFISNSNGNNIVLDWSFNTVNNDSVQQYFSNLGLHEEFLAVTDENQCVDTAVIAIDVLKPVADFVIDQYTANCPPLLCSFVDASSSSVINWEWSFSDSSLYYTQNPSKLFNESGSYDIQLVVNDSIGCSDTLKIDDAIQINGPSGNFSISDLEVCAAEPIEFSANTQNTNNIIWDFGDGNFSSNSTEIHLYNQVGIYYPQLTIISVFGCQEIVSQDSVIVGNNTVFIDEIEDVSVCPGDSVIIDIQTNGSLESWAPTIGVLDTLSLNTLLRPDTTTLYIVSVKDGNCVNKDSILVTVHEKVIVPEYFIEHHLCVGEEVNFVENTHPHFAYSFDWNIQGNTYNYNPSVVFDNSGEFPVILTLFNDSTSCYSSLVDTVFINENPVANAGEDIIVCEQDSFMLSAIGEGSFLWNGFFINQQLFLCADSTKEYELLVTDTNGCQSLDHVLVEVQYLPKIQVIGDFSLCLGDSLHLQSFDNSLYYWGSHLTSNEIKTLPTISQSILVWKYDEYNCYNEQIVEIEVFDTNSVDLIKPSVICENEDFILDINVNGPRLSRIDWKIGGQSFNSNPIDIQLNSVGSFNVEVILENIHGCFSTETIYDAIEVKKMPNATFYQLNTDLSEINNLAWFKPKNHNYEIYKWDFGDGYYSNASEPIHEYEEAGVYFPSLEVTNEFGCSDLYTKDINIESDYTLWIPNTFTPNGDGLDEIFAPKGIGVEAFNMIVYTRWGEEVYFSQDLNSGWDGMLTDMVQAPTGIYTYRIVTEDFNGKVRTYQGEVNLIL